MSQQLQSSTPTTARPTCTAAEELADHTSTTCHTILDDNDSISWWLMRIYDTVKKLLPPLAIDILATPSLEAFVERVFSLSGDFTTGK